MYVPKEPELIKKLRIVKNYFERFYVILVCLLWIVATCWDVYKLQRYWFDYALEFYSSFLIFITLIYSICPKAIPRYIYKSFKIVTKIKGRGIIFIIISLIFLKDKHAFHRFSAFILLIAGVLCLICELLIPTTREELKKIDEIYGIVATNKSNDLSIFNNSNNNRNNIEEKVENNDIDKVEEKNIEIKSENDITSEEKNIKDSNNKEIEVKNQSTNPYDLPDDF